MIPGSVKVFEALNKIYNITLSANYYHIFSLYNQLIITPFGTLPENLLDVSSQRQQPVSSVDYIHVISDINFSTDLISMKDDDICLIIAEIDTGNIITTNEYPELKDNTGGTSSNAPRGASRNLLRVTNISSRLTKLSNMNISDLLDHNYYQAQIAIRIDNVILNAAASQIPPKYLLAYAKKQNDIITFYHSNGIKIQ